MTWSNVPIEAEEDDADNCTIDSIDVIKFIGELRKNLEFLSCRFLINVLIFIGLRASLALSHIFSIIFLIATLFITM